MAGPDPAAARAGELLGWGSTALAETRLLGQRVIPVVELDPDAHRRRLATGNGPQSDPDVLAIWEWPQAVARSARPPVLAPCPEAPPRPLGLVGVLVRAHGRSAARAVTQARQWRGFGATAVLAADALITDTVRFECDVAGVGLLALPAAAPPPGPAATAPVLVVPAAAGRRPPARRRVADRWVEEVLYGQALHQDLLHTPAGGLW